MDQQKRLTNHKLSAWHDSLIAKESKFTLEEFVKRIMELSKTEAVQDLEAAIEQDVLKSVDVCHEILDKAPPLSKHDAKRFLDAHRFIYLTMCYWRHQRNVIPRQE